MVSGGSWHLDLHFRRLAIVDLDPRSNQPFESGAASLLYNGELYNATDLREMLGGRGVVFHTTGDTEVLYQLLQQPDWTDLLSRIDGMFAFVLVLPTGEVRYGRDRLGIKPLYASYDRSGALTGLASEIRPLRAAGLVQDVDAVAVAAAAMFLWVPPPATGWRDCRQVAAGTGWTSTAPDFADCRLAWSASLPGPSDMSIGEAVATSVARQVQADVPVALLLSGGLDSSWLALELTRQGFGGPFLAARPHVVGQDAEPFEDDAPYAQRVADALGRPLQWSELDVDVLHDLPSMVHTLEQPFGDPAAITLMRLSAAAAHEAKVLLSGVGVEELFLGYERYQAIKLLQTLGRGAGWLQRPLDAAPLPSRLTERAAKFRRLLALPPADWVWASQAYYSPQQWARLSPTTTIDAVVARHRALTDAALSSGGSVLEAAAATDRALFLPGLNLMYADRASMSASVELRVPFLGEQVVAAAASVSAKEHVGIGNGKRAFRAAAASAGVPDFVVRRSKTGFGAPVRSIMRAHGPRVWDSIKGSGLFSDFLDGSVAASLFADHAAGRQELGLQTFGLTSLAVWWDENVAGTSRAGDALRGLVLEPPAH